MKIEVGGVVYLCKPSDLDTLKSEVRFLMSPDDYSPGNYFWLAPDPSDYGLA